MSSPYFNHVRSSQITRTGAPLVKEDTIYYALEALTAFAHRHSFITAPYHLVYITIAWRESGQYKFPVLTPDINHIVFRGPASGSGHVALVIGADGNPSQPLTAELNELILRFVGTSDWYPPQPETTTQPMAQHLPQKPSAVRRPTEQGQWFVITENVNTYVYVLITDENPERPVAWYQRMQVFLLYADQGQVAKPFNGVGDWSKYKRLVAPYFENEKTQQSTQPRVTNYEDGGDFYGSKI